MKKMAFFVAAVTAAMLLMVGCGNQDAGQSANANATENKDTLIVGVDDSFPPMGFRDDKNEIVGFDIDLANEVGKRMGKTIKIQAIDWTAKENELNTKNIDMIWNGYTVTEERAKQVLFSDTYLENNQVVVVRKDKGFSNLNSLAGKTVGAQAGSTAMDALEEAKEFKDSLKEVVEFKENTMALMDLETGGVDAVVVDEVVADYYIATGGKDNLVVLDEKLTPEEYAIGFRKADTELCKKVNDTLAAMASDGSLAELSTKWFGKDNTKIGK